MMPIKKNTRAARSRIKAAGLKIAKRARSLYKVDEERLVQVTAHQGIRRIAGDHGDDKTDPRDIADHSIKF